MKIRSFGIKVRLMLKKLIVDIRTTHLKDLRNVTLSNVRKLPDIIHLRNLVFFSAILSFVVLALFVQRFTTLEQYFVKESPANGGNYSQGVIGNIDNINPLFVQNDAENATSKLVFSGLTRVIDGNTYVPDLAESWTIDKTGKIYTFKLRKNLTWQDGKPLTADDIVFTIGLIQNPDTRTPASQIWRGVTVAKVNDRELTITLPNVYPDFLSVASQGILPQHILGGVDPKNIKVAEFNTQPVGSGPYRFVRFDQIGSQTEAVFEKFDKFAIHKPYLDEVRLVLYGDEQTLFEGLSRRQIGGIANISVDKYKNLSSVSNVSLFKKYLPEYQVVYMNMKNDLLSNKDIRTAIAGSINRKELVDKVLSDYGEVQATPILPGKSGYDPKAKIIPYDIPAANALLDKIGWVKGKDGIRTKDGKKLSFRLVYPSDVENIKDADILKKQLSEIGVEIVLTPANISLISSNFIRPRNFDILLIGQNVGFSQDFYSFWHSSQATDPGLNLSGFSDKKVDRLVEQVRRSTDEKYRADRYKEIQAAILDAVPVVYLYKPTELYAISSDVKGSEQKKIAAPLDILNNIHNWYINVNKSY